MHVSTGTRIGHLFRLSNESCKKLPKEVTMPLPTPSKRRVGGARGPAVPEGDELLRRCCEGDSDALTALVNLFQDRLFHLACRVLEDPARAEEAVLDAFLKVWDRCGQWRGEASAGTWIYQVALRTFLDHA